MYLLYCLESNLKVELPISQGAEYKRLQLMGLLDDDLKLTQAGINLVLEANRIFLTDKEPVAEVTESEYVSFLEEYRMLFPSTREAGKLVRNNITDLLPRMRWFNKTYPQYSKEQILDATRAYINSFDGFFKYCMTSAYFIKKDDKNKTSLSSLSSWCEGQTEKDPDQSPSIALGFNKLI